MLGNNVGSSESFLTVPACERLLTCVNSSVFHETAPAGEYRLAFIASERFSVDVHVCVALEPEARARFHVAFTALKQGRIQDGGSRFFRRRSRRPERAQFKILKVLEDQSSSAWP